MKNITKIQQYNNLKKVINNNLIPQYKNKGI